jgi:hypothetical protein
VPAYEGTVGTRDRGRRRHRVWLVALAGLLVACSGGAASRPAAPRASPVPAAGGSAPSTPLPPCRSASTQPPTPAGPVSSGPLWTIAAGLDQPDDLLFANGSLLVGVLGAGRILVLAPGRAPEQLPVQIPAVEGMVYIGEHLYAAGQAQDVVDEISGSQVRTVLQLQPVPGRDGVDGITAQGGQLVVPDSPHGVVDWVDPATGHVTRQVGGFDRPTGAWPASDGSLLVADEYGNAAVRVAPDGGRSYLVRGLPIVDDIAQDSQGSIFVATPVVTGGRLSQLAGGAATDVVSHLAAPQGIAVDGADNLYVSEEDAGRVDLLVRTFKLIPLAPVPDSPVQPVCVDLVRAAGFSGDVALSGDAGLRVVQQPGTGGQGAILVTGCRPDPCRLTATSGGRTDTLWVQAQA